MVKTNNHSESEDLQISKFNEFFLVADRIRKAGRSARQGFGKFKSKPNPNGGSDRLSIPTSSENAPFTNGSVALVTPSVQSSHEALFVPSDPPSRNPLSKEERKEIRAPEAPTAPSSLTRCLAPNRIVQAISKRSNGGAREGHRQRSPPEILLPDIPAQAALGADKAASKFPSPQVLPSQSLSLLRFLKPDSAFIGQRLD